MPNHEPPQLFLIDGYAFIYRAFFALISRPLRTARGENTSAAWGVTNFLLRLREKYRPRLPRLGQRRRRFVPHRASTPSTSPPARSWTTNCRLTSTPPSSACANCSPPSGFRWWRWRDTRPTTSSAPWPLRLPRRAGGGGRLGRQGLLPADPPRGRRCSTPAAAAPPASRKVGDRGQRGRAPRRSAASGDRLPRTGGRLLRQRARSEGDRRKGCRELLAEFGNLETLLARASEVPGKRAREALLIIARHRDPLEAAGHHPDRCAGGTRSRHRRGPVARQERPRQGVQRTRIHVADGTSRPARGHPAQRSRWCQHGERPCGRGGPLAPS